MMNHRTKKEVLLVSLEFVQPLFSGNGIMAQSVVRGLLHLNYKVTVLCARPKPSNCGDGGASISIEGTTLDTEEKQQRMDDDPLLSVIAVDVPPSTWKKLDRNSCYEHLANGAINQISKLKKNDKENSMKYNYDYVFAIDWSAIPAIDILTKHNHIIPSSSIFVFLVFRVFSSSKELCSSEDDYLFYVTRELEAIERADITFVLSHVDQRKLVSIQKEQLLEQKEPIVNNEPILKDLHVHVPPLRNDFYHKCQKLDNGDTPLSSSSSIVMKKRKYILCNVRLSPEKNALLFANIMKTLSEDGTLQELGLVPIMIGSVCDDTYAQSVYNTLPSETVVINKFLCSDELITILTQTVLMIHPPIYDAFGMTISEAAAVGVPTLIHHENIGASSLFRVEEGEILYGDMNSNIDQISNCVRNHLQSSEKLSDVSEKAKERAMSWNVNEYALGLELALHNQFGN